MVENKKTQCNLNYGFHIEKSKLLTENNDVHKDIKKLLQ